MVTDSQKAAIQASWSAVNLKDAGRTFYVRFSEVAPEAFALFKFGGEDVHTSAKVGVQADKTMNFLDSAVKGLDNMGAVAASLDQLGHRHTGYGAKKAHFQVAEGILMYTLEKHAGGKWTAEAKEAWAALYKIIASHITAHLSS